MQELRLTSQTFRVCCCLQVVMRWCKRRAKTTVRLKTSPLPLTGTPLSEGVSQTLLSGHSEGPASPESNYGPFRPRPAEERTRLQGNHQLFPRNRTEKQFVGNSSFNNYLVIGSNEPIFTVVLGSTWSIFTLKKRVNFDPFMLGLIDFNPSHFYYSIYFRF